MRRVFLAVVLVATTARAAEPTPRLGAGVELVMFGAPWCQPCREMIPVLRELRQEGYVVWYARADVDPNLGILEAQELTRLPAWIMYCDRRPIARTEGKLPKAFLITWIGREQRAARLVDQSKREALDVRFLRENHWRLSPGTCGMLGCQVHGGGWFLE